MISSTAADVFLDPAHGEPAPSGQRLPLSGSRPVAAAAAPAPSIPVQTFGAVYREQFRFVWRSLRRLGIGEHECADAAQQVFVIVHRRLDEFRNEAKVTTWLFAICANVVANTRRSRGRRNEVWLDEATAPPNASAHARSEARLTLEWLLEGMPLDQRMTFLMFEVEELTCAEIAKVTDTPVGTVKSRLRLARARIASQLGLELPQEESEVDDA